MRGTLPVICVTGMPGCGKEEFIKVCANHGYQITRMGDVVREEARRRGLPFSDPNVGGLADEERRIHGPDIWARRTLPFVQSSKCVIDGLRSDAELKVFRNSFAGSLRLVAILSSLETRFRRLVARGREDDILSRDEFDRREERETAWGLGALIESADVGIENDGTLEEFKISIEDFLGGLGE
ncbi:MAG: flagellar hook-basal body complex protein FliE [Thermoplasmata archaeon]|nr:flagellar hook-basal body complex protein FliE [Thermoplasmata archaeon]